MHKNQMLENRIEQSLVQGVKARGGMCLKFTSPGNPGVPDRIVLTPDGRIYFVELKTEIGRLQNIQKWMLGQFEQRGANVRVLKGADAVKSFLEEVLPREV
jgi:hypothetical protein